MRVLFLTHRLPYAPNRGDRIRSYHILQQLLGFTEVHLFSLADDEEVRHLRNLPDALASVHTVTPSHLRNRIRALAALPGSQPLTHVLLDAPGLGARIANVAERVRPDLLFAYCTGLARFALDPPLASIPCILDMVDVDSEKWRELSEQTGGIWKRIYRREARTLQQFEIRATRHSHVTFVINDREYRILKNLAPSAEVQVVGNGVDTQSFRPNGPASQGATVIFCGVMDYAPNVDGVLHFAHHIWPLVRRTRPDARFKVVGARPVKAIQELHRPGDIEVTGAVSDVRPFLWDAAVSVAPVRLARGLQNKVLEALAAGLPVIATRAVAAGLPAQVLPACIIADDDQAFGEGVLSLLDQAPSARRAFVERADLSGLTWNATLRNLVDTIDAFRRRNPGR